MSFRKLIEPRDKTSIVITGSRSITDKVFIEQAMLMASEELALVHQLELNNINTRFILGGAVGVDRLVQDFVEKQNFETEIILPDWNLHGRSAGFKRNIIMADKANICIAIWDGKSNGTKHMIDYCQKKPILTLVYN